MANADRLDFAQVAHQIANADVRTRERRRFRRAMLVVNGRMLDPLGREHDCRTADLSPGDGRLAAPILPDVGQNVVLYLEGFGRVAGAVTRRCGEAEVAIVFNQSAHKREKMAEALMWAMNKEQLGLETIERRSAGNTHRACVELENGDAIEGQVLDFSLAGMTIATEQAIPLIGAWVRVGNVYGRVARRIDGGFAIDFENRKLS